VRPTPSAPGSTSATRRPASSRDEAERAYRRALALSAEDRDALNNLAWLLLEEGRSLEEAETLAAKAAAQPGPDRPLALDTLGRVQLARGRCDEATSTFVEALAAESLEGRTRPAMEEALARARDCSRAAADPSTGPPDR
jgi:Tfp pilus assembly protein PilF